MVTEVAAVAAMQPDGGPRQERSDRMTYPDVVSPEQWLEARRDLLAKEKELTKARDELNADRRRLPMVRVEKEYTFTGPDGPVRLLDLFGDHRQLVIQHFMFPPEWDTGCPSCTAGVDELSTGLLEHLRARDTEFALVSRAPIEKLLAYQKTRGWDITWVSSFGTDFNYDFHVSLDAAVAPVMFNYRDAEELAAAGFDWVLAEPTEQPGMSVFLRDGDQIFHTYSTFGRGTEQMGGAYGVLDMTALGRQEEWEEPKGRALGEGHRAVPDFST
jgi:predicted dithiol-disulfide oxidoreductase (DUF899 family)